VEDWMTPDPITISSTATLGDAYDCMLENDVRRLPVVDEADELIGIVTRSDVLQAVPPLQGVNDDGEIAAVPLSEMPIRDIMAWEPVTVAPSDTIRRAAQRMIEYQISGLPVVEGDQLVGIITESDIFRVVIEFLDDRRGKAKAR
ncbi:MAG: CBS domain-containing protein, partial [Chloroflexota bacterium]|nr:CBS domain-containing protein [Chloroflexota bacterium]